MCWCSHSFSRSLLQCASSSAVGRTPPWKCSPCGSKSQCSSENGRGRHATPTDRLFWTSCVCQPDLAHFDTQIWPPNWTNNPSLFPLLSVFRGAGRSEAQRRRFCGAFGRSVGRITLDMKCAGARSAGNPHATCDVAGAGIPFTVRLVRHSQRKRGATDRLDLRNYGASPRPSVRPAKAGHVQWEAVPPG